MQGIFPTATCYQGACEGEFGELSIFFLLL